MGPLYGTVHRSTFLVGFYRALLGRYVSYERSCMRRVDMYLPLRTIDSAACCVVPCLCSYGLLYFTNTLSFCIMVRHRSTIKSIH